MRTRLLTLPALALLAAGVAAAPPNPPGATAGPKGASLDGPWAVVSAAREGLPIPGADKTTVTIKGNVVTFAGADKSMRALLLDFGRDGVLFVREAGADGKFDTVGAGTQPASGATAGPAPAAGLLIGAYVMTPDFLALSVSKPGAGLGLPGGPTTGTGTNPPPTAGKGTQPGGPGAAPGAPAPGTRRGLPNPAYLSVILKRSGATGGSK